jgi:DNA-binding CsgD family transcriptional regulator
MSTTVVGRDEELAAIRAFLRRIEGSPHTLVLSGEAGIGKTILWEIGVQEAEQHGLRVLAGRESEAEASLSFAGLSDLLAPSFDDIAASLLPPRRRALEIALLRIEPGAEPPDQHAIGLAVLDALSALAEHGPVLVALDDVQWLDQASASVIQIALRRLRDERVGLLATFRTGPELTSPLELGRSYAENRLERLTIGPLSVGAVHGLLKERLGLEMTRPELARVHEATAGNPFFALEVGRELVRTGVRPTPGQALRVPESLRELLGDRLARLPAETADVLLQVAALARPTIGVVTAAHGRPEGVRRGLEAAVKEGVVALDDSSVRFTHPLLASLCYEQAPVWKRRAVHDALAGAVSDVEERARHRALAVDGPDAAVAAELDAAAEHAAARGATTAAGELSELAAELTPGDPDLARSRRLRAASYHRLATGVGGPAVPILEQLLGEVTSGVERADILLELAATRRADSRAGVELCTEALTEAADDDTRTARILCHRALFYALSGDGARARDDARLALERAERAGDPALLVTAITRVGTLETWTADVTPGLLERGAGIEERLGRPLHYHQSPRVALARRLLRVGELDRARTLLEKLETEAAARGDEDTRVMILGFDLVPLEWQAGRWPRALQHAASAYDLAEQIADLHGRGLIDRNKALVEADLGLVEQARASAQEGLAFAEEASNEWFVIRNLGVLGRIELVTGDLERASDILHGLPGRLVALGLNDPADPVWPDTIETLIAVGEREQARAYLDSFAALATRLGSPRAIVSADRCQGLLAAAEGDLEAASEPFERALARLKGHPFPLERGRTLLCLGAVRRQAQQKKGARDALEQALAIFEELGARLWAEKARAELARISGRAPSSDELTETERRVAELAAHGRTNKQIAAELYMGLSTVEAHLSHVYRKLGVRRAGLAGRLSVGVDAPRASTDEGRAPSLS